jgi:diguanylate cyclase (GGDEF)-like protein
MSEAANHERCVLDQHRRISDLIALIRDLSSRAVAGESAADLFMLAAPALFRCLPFDAALAVMIEQNLELCISTREGAGGLVNDEVIGRVRSTLGTVIPMSFAEAEVVVRAEEHELPPREGELALTHQIHAVVEQGRRISGVILVYRGDRPFTIDDQQTLTIFTTQISLLLGMMDARARVTNLADTDDLTGIWNRRYFRRQLPQEIERSRIFSVPVSMLLFDIDDFKQINDSLGHVVGDVVLSELCGAVREGLRPTDLLARFGGDEFAVILPHTDAIGAVAVADRLLDRVRSLTIPTDEEASIRCSVSVGIAEYRRDEPSNDFIRRADERLYQAKRGGKNRYSV